jgi:3-methyladenine DNA glycosylase AlkD
MNQILAAVRSDLSACADEKTKDAAKRFFKEQAKFYGVKSPDVSKIAKKYLSQIRQLSKAQIFALCEELFKSDYTEEAFIVANWLPELDDKLEPGDLVTFKGWIECYINNWAKCDSFCNHTIGIILEKYPDCVLQVKSWANSENRWLKRASAVSLIIPAKNGMFLNEAFEISNQLLVDGEDLVQKGYGWLLKEESRKHQKEVYAYVLKNRQVMPRTALRYAIELMPKELKVEAMKKC